MSSAALYKAFIDAGASEEKATQAVEDVIQVSQLPELATKADISKLEARIAGLELSTKADFSKLESSTKADFSKLESSMDARFTAQALSTEARIADLRAEMKDEVSRLESKIDKLETRLITWMVGCMFVAASLAVAGAGVLVQVMLSSGVVQ